MYANDCIEIKERQHKKTLKRIDMHTKAELNAAIEKAARRFGADSTG